MSPNFIYACISGGFTSTIRSFLAGRGNHPEGMLLFPLLNESHSGSIYGLLWFGILMFTIAVAGTCTGQIWGRNGQKTFRAKDPSTYWSGIAAYYLAGIGLVGYYLYKVHAEWF